MAIITKQCITVCGQIKGKSLKRYPKKEGYSIFAHNLWLKLNSNVLLFQSTV